MKIPFNSINYKLVLWVLLIMIPIISFCIFQNWYAINVVRNQVSESNKGTLELYVELMDQTLVDAEKYLANLAYNNEDLNTGAKAESEYEKYLRQYVLSKKIASAKFVYPKVDGFFIYSRSNKEFLEKSNRNDTLEERERIRAYIKALSPSSNNENTAYEINSWFEKKIGEKYYLLRIYKIDEYYIGAWIDIDNLLAPLRATEFALNKPVFLASNDGVPLTTKQTIITDKIELGNNKKSYYLVGKNEHYLVLSKEFKEGDFSLVAIIKENNILEGLDQLQKVITYISLASIAIIPMSLFLIKKSVLTPLQRIVAAMLAVKEGNFNAKIGPLPTYNEFQTVNETFDSMLTQIKQLKINVYEEQLLKQKAELNYYQLQINPHFFLNSLNIIYGLAQVKKYNIIQDMTMCLVKHFRYTLKSSGHSVVKLEEEIGHIRNYLVIQEMRFPENISYDIVIDSQLMEAMILPMSIHTFVENSIKHAINLDEKIEIKIKVTCETIGANKWLYIYVEDTGEGFDKSILELLSEKKRIYDEKGEHIGIHNVMQRLNILFGEAATLHFHNSIQGGAVVEIKLPLILQAENGVNKNV